MPMACAGEPALWSHRSLCGTRPTSRGAVAPRESARASTRRGAAPSHRVSQREPTTHRARLSQTSRVPPQHGVD